MLSPRSRDLSRLLTLRHIRIISELDSTRSFAHSAENLGISYAAISKALIEIEQIAGSKLFERSFGKLIPTDACLLFLSSGRQILKEMDFLSWRLGGSDIPLQGRVRIAFQAPALESRFVDWCVEIVHRHPGIMTSWEFTKRSEILKGLERGYFDIGIAGLFGSEDWQKLEFHPISSDYYFFVSTSGSLTCDFVFQNWEDYREKLWVLPVGGMATREYFNRKLKDLDLPIPRRVIEVNSSIRVTEMLARFDGIAMITSSMWENRLLPPSPPVDSRYDTRQGIIWSKIRNHSQEVKFAIDVMTRN